MAHRLCELCESQLLQGVGGECVGQWVGSDASCSMPASPWPPPGGRAQQCLLSVTWLPYLRNQVLQAVQPSCNTCQALVYCARDCPARVIRQVVSAVAGRLLELKQRPRCDAGGMNGLMLMPAGEVCPTVVPAPLGLGDDITSNGVCCACYRSASCASPVLLTAAEAHWLPFCCLARLPCTYPRPLS